MVGRLTTALVAAAMVFTGAFTTQTYDLNIGTNCTANSQCYNDDGLGNITGACVTDQSVSGHSCVSRFGAGYSLTGGVCKTPSTLQTCTCSCFHA